MPEQGLGSDLLYNRWYSRAVDGSMKPAQINALMRGLAV